MMWAMWEASFDVMELWLRSTLVMFVCVTTAAAAFSKRALLMLLNDNFASDPWFKVERMLSKCTDMAQRAIQESRQHEANKDNNMAVEETAVFKASECTRHERVGRRHAAAGARMRVLGSIVEPSFSSFSESES